jgi:hypothetical protein
MAYHQKKEKEDNNKKRNGQFPLKKRDDNLEVQNYQHILNQ